MRLQARIDKAERAARAAGAVDKPEAVVARFGGPDGPIYYNGRPITESQLHALEQSHAVTVIVVEYVVNWRDDDGQEHTEPGVSSWPPASGLPDRIDLKWPEDE